MLYLIRYKFVSQPQLEKPLKFATTLLLTQQISSGSSTVAQTFTAIINQAVLREPLSFCVLALNKLWGLLGIFWCFALTAFNFVAVIFAVLYSVTLLITWDAGSVPASMLRSQTPICLR